MGELRTVEVEVVIEDSELNDWIGKKKKKKEKCELIIRGWS